jgi:hypothetical protein
MFGSRQMASGPSVQTGALVAALGAVALTSSGCIQDTDCGICDPNKLVLESMTAVNYANQKVHILQGTPDNPKYFIDDLIQCPETDDALDAPRGADEWCKISPLITWQGVELVFNNLLDPADFINAGVNDPERVTRRVNLTCIDNLNSEGGFNQEILEGDPTICEQYDTVDGVPMPRKMQYAAIDGVEPTTKAYRGRTDWRSNSCSTPDEGPDTCCTVCDYELSVNVWKYGEDPGGEKARPGGGAIECAEADDVFESCAGFVNHVNRDEEFAQYVYDWDGDAGPHALPWYDQIRSTHPDGRPTSGALAEHAPLACDDDQTCSDAGLEGTQCIGQRDGTACTQGDDCLDKHCKAEWFVECRVSNDTTGAAGYCVDKRFDDSKAAACFTANQAFDACDPVDPASCVEVRQGARLAQCDMEANGAFTADQCCPAILTGGAMDGQPCDPTFMAGVTPVDRFDRDSTLPDATRACFCGDLEGQADDCVAQVEEYCNDSNQGQYITRFVTKIGGVVYDPAIKGIDYRPGDIGNENRSLIESCAESRNLIGERNIQDGWLAHEGFTPENYENFDRGMCSGQEYTVVFATGGEHVRDKVGNDLSSESTYTFTTPQFHIVPESGFPTDNLRIGACDEFELRMSNKFDMDPENLKKIEVRQLVKLDGSTMVDPDNDGDEESCDDNEFVDSRCWEPAILVAGGLACSEDPLEVLAGEGAVVPCLTVDVADQSFGTVGVSVDAVRFSRKLFDEGKQDDFGRESTGRYRMVIPGLGYDPGTGTYPGDVPGELKTNTPMADYQAAFHDVCGMPLIVGDDSNNLIEDFYYDFTVDEPKCRDDKDGDQVQASCDNANKVYNPDQTDSDADTFGDVIDLCPITPGSSNTSDSDKDGVGNQCDNCRKAPDKYNIAEGAALPESRYWVRNNWQQIDTDQDGIGDVCDNCIVEANCEDYGPGNPHVVGTEVQDESEVLCQADADSNMIGDICEGAEGPDAAGPVGFGPDDDFDQDGLTNLVDMCPRQPVALVACTDDSECGDAACSSDGVCQHEDTDGDGVGNICDTCPFAANPDQTTDMGMQLDDEDDDGVGAACESASACATTKDPRPLALYEVSVDGFCCTTLYQGDGEYVQNEDGTWDCEGLCDPDGLPIQRNCENEPATPEERIPDGVNCRSLPEALQAPKVYGVTDLPPGCQDALDAAGKCDPGDPMCDDANANQRLTSADEPDDAILWQNLCVLPQRDQDFDGLGDICDKCEYAFDPFNESYIDENGKFWPDAGKYCNGAYNPDVVCEMEDEGEDDGGETGETGDTGGDETG